MNQDNASFGKVLQTCMEAHGISKTILAKILGESERTIEGILNDDIYLSKGRVAVLADLFGIPYDYFCIIQDWAWKSYQEEKDK